MPNQIKGTFNMAKFKAKQIETGEWAVFSGKKYFLHSVTNDETLARIEAAHRTALWHLEQMDKAKDEMEKLGAFDNGSNFEDWCS